MFSVSGANVNVEGRDGLSYDFGALVFKSAQERIVRIQKTAIGESSNDERRRTRVEGFGEKFLALPKCRLGTFSFSNILDSTFVIDNMFSPVADCASVDGNPNLASIITEDLILESATDTVLREQALEFFAALRSNICLRNVLSVAE